MAAACGICLSKRQLVAVFVDDGHATPAICAALDDDDRWTLLERVDEVHGLDYALVLPDDLLKCDSIGLLALNRGCDLWAAPQPLVEAVRRAAAISTAPRLAAMIARLAIVPGFRTHLRHIHPSSFDSRQLTLL